MKDYIVLVKKEMFCNILVHANSAEEAEDLALDVSDAEAGDMFETECTCTLRTTDCSGEKVRHGIDYD